MRHLYLLIKQNENENVTSSRVKISALGLSLRSFSVMDCSKSVFWLSTTVFHRCGQR